jgi:hypothetical protein
MTRELKHFNVQPFYKAIIGANHVTDAKNKNMPKEFQKYPDKNCKSYQGYGHFMITQDYKRADRKL